jgi:hypothetical protein
LGWCRSVISLFPALYCWVILHWWRCKHTRSSESLLRQSALSWLLLSGSLEPKWIVLLGPALRSLGTTHLRPVKQECREEPIHLMRVRHVQEWWSQIMLRFKLLYDSLCQSFVVLVTRFSIVFPVDSVFKLFYNICNVC